MRNLRLVVEYDGSRFAGWQRQENGPSIQGEIEAVLEQILREKISLLGAGRTDAGVHARGQVANFRTDNPLSAQQIMHGLNSLLPNEIVIHKIDEVPLEFHARYSARQRQYTYLITREPTALLRSFSWLVTYPLHIVSMRQAAEIILGEHDFSSFCRAKADVQHHRCMVTMAEWQEEGSLLRFSIGADRFLHGMVRTLVGTMVDLGRGYISLAQFRNILDLRDRTKAGMAAPARGLVLDRVIY